MFPGSKGHHDVYFSCAEQGRLGVYRRSHFRFFESRYSEETPRPRGSPVSCPLRETGRERSLRCPCVVVTSLCVGSVSLCQVNLVVPGSPSRVRSTSLRDTPDVSPVGHLASPVRSRTSVRPMEPVVWESTESAGVDETVGMDLDEVTYFHPGPDRRSHRGQTPRRKTG